MSAHGEARGQSVMEQDTKKITLIEFMKVFKQAAEVGAFADPQKLNEMIPMTVQWPSQRESGGSSWVSAKLISLTAISQLQSNQLNYRLRTPDMWAFSVSKVDQVACISFDEMAALWGGKYQLSPKLYRRHTQGSPVLKPGPQKMAGEGVFYALSGTGLDRRISVTMSYEGCIESINARQIT